MKKRNFSFTTVFTFLFILVFAVACSNDKEADEGTTDETNEAVSNEVDTTTEIDYTDTDTDTDTDTEEDTREEVTTKVENTNTNTKTPVNKTQPKTTQPKTQQPKVTNNNVETAPKTQPKLKQTNNNVESSPKTKPKLKQTNNNVETPSTSSNKPKMKLEAKKFKKPAKSFSHGAWDDLLRKHVSSSGKVNYAGFKSDKSKLKAYLKDLSNNEPKGKSNSEQIAYWINAYNAYTVDLIVDNYPISSILKLDNGKTWSVKRITIGGKKYSLEQIEKNILIGRFKEPRIHFAINCAAKSCPPLKNRAWKGSGLNADLDRASRGFINNSSYNQISSGSAKLSKIFDWYKSDFNDVNSFINKYADAQITGSTNVSYNEYNWNLNK